MAAVPQRLLHKVYSRKDAVKGELSRKGQERDKTVWPFKSHIPATSEIVGPLVSEIRTKLL